MRIGGQDSQGRFLVPATVAYDGTMWRTTLAVSPGGEVEMIDEKDPVALGAVRVPAVSLHRSTGRRRPRSPPRRRRRRRRSHRMSLRKHRRRKPRPVPPVKPPVLEETVSDRDITRAVVSVLLADAVRERVGNTLLKRFNSQTQADDPDRAARAVRQRLAPHHHHRSGHPVRRGHRRRFAGTGARPQGQARRGPGQGRVGRRLAMLPRSLGDQCRRLSS